MPSNNDAPPSGDDDELAAWLADPERFVRGGRHEPAARTRAAVTRFPDGHRSRPVAPPRAPRDPFRRRERHGRSRRRSLLVWVVVIAVAAGAGVLLSRHGGGGTGAGGTPLGAPLNARPLHSAIPSETPNPDATPEPSDTEPPVDGIGSTDAVGTCYALASDGIDLRATSCSGLHDRELVAHELASGPDDTYPSDAYWNGPVADLCYSDDTAYVGGEHSTWPAGADESFLRPTVEGWRQGDRGVFCLLTSTPAATGSLAHRATPDGPGMPAPAAGATPVISA